MPREDVPYPTSAICSIRERIAELRDELDQLLKTVNGVAGDANHDIKLVSGDPAIVINNDQAQHEIEIALDSSQLPAASVVGVNGKVGNVMLYGPDIPLNSGQSTPTVQNAVAANSGNIAQLQQDLNQEITDRGNADATLQTNINLSNARISLIENAIDANPTPDTIALRDANGRMQAADPASGATDKTLVTANWVSQTGDSAPNNLVHRSANETIAGNKIFTGRPKIKNSWVSFTLVADNWDPANPQAIQDAAQIWVQDKNGTNIGGFRFNQLTNGNMQVQLVVRNSNGTLKYTTLATGDII